MTTEQFKCATPKCSGAIATEGLNRVKLKALRRWDKYCSYCGKRTRWIEQSALPLNTEIIKPNRTNGGSYDASNIQINQKPDGRYSKKRRAAHGDA